jgi:hypothetical protein
MFKREQSLGKVIGQAEPFDPTEQTEENFNTAVATVASVAVVAVGALVFEAALLPGLCLGVAAVLVPKFLSPKNGDRCPSVIGGAPCLRQFRIRVQNLPLKHVASRQLLDGMSGSLGSTASGTTFQASSRSGRLPACLRNSPMSGVLLTATKLRGARQFYGQVDGGEMGRDIGETFQIRVLSPSPHI